MYTATKENFMLPRLLFNKSTGYWFTKWNGGYKYFSRDADLATIEFSKFILEITEEIRALSETSGDNPERVITRKTQELSEKLIITVNKAVTKFIESLPQGKPVRHDITRIGQLLGELHGSLDIKSFTRTHFRELITAIGGLTLSKSTKKTMFGYVKNLFNFLFQEELIDLELWAYIRDYKFRVLEGKESKRVPPVPIETVNKTLDFMPEVIRDMIQFQLFTGTRAGEVCSIAENEIDKAGNIWIYSPKHHKTEHHGKKRTIFIGPKAQAILNKYLDNENSTINSSNPIFSPSDSEYKRKIARRKARKTKVQPSQIDRSKPNPERKPGNRYDTHAYARAISRACNKAIQAGVLRPEEKWHNHQLRHTAATEARKIAGLDGAQVFLGHSSASVTEIYAEKDNTLGERVAAMFG